MMVLNGQARRKMRMSEFQLSKPTQGSQGDQNSARNEETRKMVFSRTRIRTRFVVLPPCRQTVSKRFRNVQVDSRHYDELLAAMQRLRGEVYLSDGAIQAGDLIDGRHKMSIDEQSWHVLSVDSGGRICACLRYLEHHNARSLDDLSVRDAALAACPRFGSHFRLAVEAEMMHARLTKLGFGEVGGWAVAEPFRRTLEPLRVILTSYGLGQLLGGCVGVATATFRHCSAAILRKIGLHPLEWGGAQLPPYYDKRYGCQMEVLRFDTRSPKPKYQDSVRELSSVLAESPVICHEAVKPDCEGAWDGAGRVAPLVPPQPRLRAPVSAPWQVVTA
jgi:hypothetical protein